MFLRSLLALALHDDMNRRGQNTGTVRASEATVEEPGGTGVSPSTLNASSHVPGAPPALPSGSLCTLNHSFQRERVTQ